MKLPSQSTSDMNKVDLSGVIIDISKPYLVTSGSSRVCVTLEVLRVSRKTGIAETFRTYVNFFGKPSELVSEKYSEGDHVHIKGMLSWDKLRANTCAICGVTGYWIRKVDDSEEAKSWINNGGK